MGTTLHIGMLQRGSKPGRRSTDRISVAEAEMTEALRQSILNLMQIQQAALRSVADKADARGRPKADC